MSILKRLPLTCLIALTGIATAQADLTIQKMDGKNLNVPAAAQKANASDIYIVQLKGTPIIAYEGDVVGYAATKPGKGKKVNRNSRNVKKYGAYLEKQQNQAIDSVGAEKVYNYRFALNGFAARMTAADAETLRRNSDVLNVWKNEIRYPQTDASPNYIGITESGEAWSKGHVGEDVVIGVVDTGVWPEHPSFADTPTPKKGNKGPAIPYLAPSGYTASGCDFGNVAANPSDAPFACNNKLVGARCYNSGQSSGPDHTNPCGGDGIAQSGDANTFQSARDDNGHGSHTASTSGGNNGVPAFIAGEFQGNVSGIAPRAHIAAYKVCWNGGGCASADSAMAIDDAVADGVDVINFSIGGASNFFGSADDVAFLFAAADGVWVATSNGNDGPDAGTVGTPSGVPWITAVGATQDDGVFYNELVVNVPGSVAGNYTAVEGGGDVTLADAGPITADMALVSNFYSCAAIPEDLTGKIALASRGVCSFSAKYNNAAAAGAVAIVVFNQGTPGRFDPIVMSAPGTTIPGVMISFGDGASLAAESGLNATMDEANSVSAANRIAGFSSRGPNNGALDIIKPDVSAPGVAILAAGAGTNTFMSISGTSMASPHVAGAFALLKQAHPDWSAAEARSALMTTARNGLLKTFGTAPADPFDIGAGEILPSDAFDPGLAYDAGLFEYAAFSCENNAPIFSDGSCAFLESIGIPSDGSDLNLPSIGIGELVGSQTITRTVNAVYNNNGNKTFHVSVDAPPGIDVSVSPSTIKLRKGNSASYEVTFTTTAGAALDEWAFGSLTWADDDGNYAVRSPIAVRPTAFSTVDEVDGVADGAGDGSVDVPVAFGYNGVYSTSVSGILDSIDTPVTNLTGPQGNLDIWCVDLPAMTHFRAATFDEDTSDPGADDIDLRLFRAATDCATFDIAQIGASGGATSEEVIDIANAPAGGYVIVVDFFAASNGTDTDYKVWFQPVFGDDSNTSVTAPAAAVLGTSGTVTVDYTGLAPTRNLGVLHHMDGSGEIGRTILDIDAR